MSIEQLGESLLADATKKRKREQRKAKRFTGALLGIQAANYFLRNKAKKRAETFLTSNTGLINQRTKQFNEGVGFWSDHTKMMDKYSVAGVNDWESAKRQELYDIYKQRELGSATMTDYSKFKESVDSKINDELKSYGEKLELFKNFRNIKDSETERKRFLKPIQDKMDKGVDIINRQGNLGGFLLGQVGFDSYKTNLKSQKAGGIDFVLPEGFDDNERKSLIESVEKSNKFISDLSTIDSQVKYVPLSPEERAKVTKGATTSASPISTHRTSLNRALSADASIQAQSTLSEYKFTYEGKERTIRKIYQEIQKEQGQEVATSFISDIFTYSRAAEEQFEKSNVDGRVQSAEYFLQKGITQAINERFVDNEGNTQGSSDKEPKFDINKTIEFTLNGKTVNSRLGDIQSSFSNHLLNKSKEEVETLLINIKGQLVGETVFTDMLQDMFDNKYPKERDLSSFFEYEKKFRTNPLSIPGK